ncbi:MAG: hypothetical protein LQ349_006874 [Xanthoria aureola]|nr:MAG: hypothetical protein LQ349_006874 [Xanthoria aureola]
MPAYSCHLCGLYNTFPSPLCHYCAHEYCIRCLPLIPDPSPLQPSPIDSSITCDYSSSISSLALDDEAEDEDEDLQAEDMIRQYLSIHPAHRPVTTTRPPSLLPEDEEEEPDPNPDAELPSPEEKLGEEIVVITTATPTQPFISPTTPDATKPPTSPPPLTHKHSSPFPLSSFSLFHRTSHQTSTTTPTTITPTSTSTTTAHHPTTLSPHYTWPLTAVPVTRTTNPTNSLAPPPQRPSHKRHGSLPEMIDRERENLKNAMSVQGEHLKEKMSAQGEHLKEKMSVGGEKMSRLVRKGNLLRLKEGCGKVGGGGEKGKGGEGGEGGEGG